MSHIKPISQVDRSDIHLDLCGRLLRELMLDPGFQKRGGSDIYTHNHAHFCVVGASFSSTPRYGHWTSTVLKNKTCSYIQLNYVESDIGNCKHWSQKGVINLAC